MSAFACLAFPSRSRSVEEVTDILNVYNEETEERGDTLWDVTILGGVL